MTLCLCTSIKQEYVALVQLVYETMIMQYLSLYCCYGGEGQCISMTTGYLFYSCSHFALVDARAHGTIGGKVHLCAQVNRFLNELNLLVTCAAASMPSSSHSHTL